MARMTPENHASKTRPVVAALLVALCTATSSHALAKESPAVLIVADEIPAMEVLAKQLDARVHAVATIVKPDAVPAALTSFKAVLVYIHRDLPEPAEKAFVGYAENGGHLILLHHSISSGKRKNATWFPALGIALPTGDFEAGG